MAKNTAPKSQFPHVRFEDVNDNGLLREVAIVKDWGNGSFSYIDIALLDRIDKGRLKTALMSLHADKDELYEILSRTRFSNGINGLDYFHPLVKLKGSKGMINTIQGGGLAGARPESNKLIGSEFSNPDEAIAID